MVPVKLTYYLGSIATCFLSVILFASIQAVPHPIGFGIPESKIVSKIPEKNKDFAFISPLDRNTYIYDKEEDYYAEYRRSYFAVTCKKSGWDCLRHYEILACGCIPYFLNLDQCDEGTMHLFPRELVKEAMKLEGVNYNDVGSIDPTRFNKTKYYEILEKLLNYTRKHLTTRAMAEYVLKKINYSGSGNILYLCQCPLPDYLRCLMLVGLKEIYGKTVVDIPKIPHIYKGFEGPSNLYGKGFSYSQIVEDFSIDRTNIETRILNKEFDCIIYGSIHRGMPYLDLVQKTYPAEKIVYFCGEDLHECSYLHLNNLFLREFGNYKFK